MKRLITILFIMRCTIAFSQTPKLDSLKNTEFKKDTLVKKKFKESKKAFKETMPLVFGFDTIPTNKIPKVAFIRSLLLPGWGQITNKHYYKLPFIYGAAGGGIYFINRNHQKCKEYIGYLENIVYLERIASIINNQKKPFSKEFLNIDYIGYLEEITPEVLIDGRGPFSKELLNNGAKQYRRWKQGTVIGFGLGWLLFAVESNVSAHMKSFDVSSDISFKPKIINIPGSTALGLGLTFNLK